MVAFGARGHFWNADDGIFGNDDWVQTRAPIEVGVGYGLEEGPKLHLLETRAPSQS